MKWNLVLASMVLSLGLSTQSFGFELMDRMLGTSGCGSAQKDCCQKDGVQKDCCQKDGAAQKACEPKCARRPLLGLNRCAQKGDPCQKVDPCTKDDACQKNPCQKGVLGGLLGNGACQKADPCAKDDACQKNPCQKGVLGGLLGNGACQKADPCAKDDACQKAPVCCRRPLLSDLFSTPCAKGGDVKDACQKGSGGLLGACQKADDCCQKDACQKGCAGPTLLERIFACRQMGCCKTAAKGGKCGSDGKGGKAPEKMEEMKDEVPVPPAPVVDPSAYLKSQDRVIQASTTLVR